AIALASGPRPCLPPIADRCARPIILIRRPAPRALPVATGNLSRGYSMAEERGQAREYPAWRPKPASWTKLFGTFLVALDPFKLLVAAAGILATALGWWLISLVFYNAWTVPNDNYYEDRARKNSSLTTEEERAAWANSEYHKARDTWALMHELAGPTDRANELYAKWYAEKTKDRPPGQARNMRLEVGKGGKYRLMPW